MVWYGMVWYVMLWYGNSMVWYGMVWYVMVWYGLIYVYIYRESKKNGIKWQAQTYTCIYCLIYIYMYVMYLFLRVYIYNILETPQILVASQWPLEHCRRHSPGYVLATRFRVFPSVFSLKNHGFDLRGAIKKSWL